MTASNIRETKQVQRIGTSSASTNKEEKTVSDDMARMLGAKLGEAVQEKRPVVAHLHGPILSQESQHPHARQRHSCAMRSRSYAGPEFPGFPSIWCPVGMGMGRPVEPQTHALKIALDQRLHNCAMSALGRGLHLHMHKARHSHIFCFRRLSCSRLTSVSDVISVARYFAITWQRVFFALGLKIVFRDEG
jgi:hypothetical protein